MKFLLPYHFFQNFDPPTTFFQMTPLPLFSNDPPTSFSKILTPYRRWPPYHSRWPSPYHFPECWPPLPPPMTPLPLDDPHTIFQNFDHPPTTADDPPTTLDDPPTIFSKFWPPLRFYFNVPPLDDPPPLPFSRLTPLPLAAVLTPYHFFHAPPPTKKNCPPSHILME